MNYTGGLLQVCGEVVAGLCGEVVAGLCGEVVAGVWGGC
jgi:hypothetical protein